MGVGAKNIVGRIAASLGAISEIEVKFESCADVPYGGVLFALPALLSNGLLEKTKEYFKLPEGYYRLQSIFLLLAFMALTRLKSIESLRYCAPGEWGKILGLDRIPEVRTLRKKVKILSTEGQPTKWSSELCNNWMNANPESSGILYIDGHVRVYHGNQTKLPRHYVARERLCLRATTDYWVNAMDGQPFFMLTKAVDPGLIKVIRNEIIPRLKKEVPNQPSLKELEENKYIHRFTIVYDREGYSPVFFQEMKEERIACLTYHKHPQENWLEEEFASYPVKLISGEIVKMKLAERGTYLSKKIWVREIRKLTESGHQTSILSTDYCSELAPIAGAMFARWSQENFFKYMREHFNLDRVIDYNTEYISGTTKVINPEYRKLDSKVRSKTAILNRKLAKFGAINFEEKIEPKKVEKYQIKKSELQEEITFMQKEIELIKKKRKDASKHITADELPNEEQFKCLNTQSKYFIDTIKMISYRAETAMAAILQEKMSRVEDSRSLLRSIYKSEVDIIPDKNEGTLNVNLHYLANKSNDKALQYLCDELNATTAVFPGSELRLVYRLGPLQNP